MLKKILIVLATLVVVFIGLVALQPSNFRISRKTTIAAVPAVVFDQVNDFHNWEAWSPWAKLDPNVVNSFSGPASGASAHFSWAGNKEVGEGNMTITESRANELIRINLQFIKPFKAAHTTQFDFKPQADKTIVTWSMSGDNNFIAKAFCLFMDMDKTVGADFEKGLAQMKTVAEAKQ